MPVRDTINKIEINKISEIFSFYKDRKIILYKATALIDIDISVVLNKISK